MSVVSGLHEFVFSLHVSERKRLLAFWAGLGFQPHAEGALSADDAEALYGHGAALTSIRLRHSGCAAHETGLVRLQCWDELAGEGLGARKPLVTGSRWMGMYTADILELRDSLSDYNHDTEDRWLSELVSAPLANPPPQSPGIVRSWDSEKPCTSTSTVASLLFSAAGSTAQGSAASMYHCPIKIVRAVTPTWCSPAGHSIPTFIKPYLASSLRPTVRPMIPVMSRPHVVRSG